MKFDFDKPTNRRGTRSVKWAVSENELPMWIADMDFETAPAVKEAITATAEHGIFGYSVTPNEYFEAISDFWAERHGYRFSPSDMIFTNGIVSAISSMVRRLTEPGEKVLIQPPVYNIFYNCIENNGRKVLENPLIYKDGVYSMDFSDLENKLSVPQTTLMILCNPHNPIGHVWERDVLCKVGELCKKHGVLVISDEIHCSLTAPGVNYTPFASVNETCADISATCIAASKTFNLAGLQASCVVVKNKPRFNKIFRGINNDEVGEPNIFAINAHIAAYTKGREWLDALNIYIAENRKFATEYINENIPRLFVVDSNASYLLWVDISAYSNDSRAFAADMRAKTGLYVSAGASYGTGGETFLRINLATQRINVEDGMRRLSNYVKTL